MHEHIGATNATQLAGRETQRDMVPWVWGVHSDSSNKPKTRTRTACYFICVYLTSLYARARTQRVALREVVYGEVINNTTPREQSECAVCVWWIHSFRPERRWSFNAEMYANSYAFFCCCSSSDSCVAHLRLTTFS